MKNYSVSSALSTLGNDVTARGKVIKIESGIGLKRLGALDFLKKHGYIVA